eukprot:TRINITY_DN34181_c0_g1_i1.p1 TRINITY_DN34181_c0_g1~~TRINITY_DN34181_c0_g1_i1.p1  ORF type:complete len:266 (-),score=23.43 TRINITY_DN34181_c0_g1_i1:54-758(-)
MVSKLTIAVCVCLSVWNADFAGAESRCDAQAGECGLEETRALELDGSDSEGALELMQLKARSNFSKETRLNGSVEWGSLGDQLGSAWDKLRHTLQKCGDQVCEEGSECCGGVCMARGAICCNAASHLMCSAGTYCCGKGGPTPMCCTTGCVANHDNLGICAIDTKPVKCGEMTCSPGSGCCGGTCMAHGATCCNPAGRLMCTPGTQCCGRGGPTPMCCTTGCVANPNNLGICGR